MISSSACGGRSPILFLSVTCVAVCIGGAADAASGASIVLAAGDIASCASNGDEATAALLDAQPDATVAVLGDAVYESGTAAEFASCYEPSWGRAKSRTRPAVGNHEYKTPGASGYFDYFGATAGDRQKGYYSYDLGGWHVVVLNTNCTFVACTAGSEQERWLRADLAASSSSCTLAYGHHPRFSSGNNHGSSPELVPLWQALYDGGAEILLGGHDHVYERFAPQTAAGSLDADYGMRQFTVGTGGKSLYGFGVPLPNSEARYASGSGVLELTLTDGSYSWRFLPVAGTSYSESGSGACHGTRPAPPPSSNLIVNGGFEAGVGGWGGYQATLSTTGGGATGLNAARVSVAAGANAYSIITSERPVSATTAGLVYTATAVTRAPSGKTVCFRLREWVGGSVVGATESCRATSTIWATAGTLTYTARGGGSLDVYAYQLGAVAGDRFEIDDISLVQGALPPPPPPPIDTTPPDTSIDSGPAGTTSTTSATFTFSATEAGSVFECSLDGAAYTTCSSPKTYAGLTVATHIFDVRARDAAGNLDPSPARRIWTVSGTTNLLPNGSFEGSLSGWTTYFAVLALVTGGIDGAQAVSVALAGAGTGYSIITSPRPVAASTAGRTYRADAYVRSGTGKRLCLRLRE